MMHISEKDKQPLSFDTGDDYAYLNDLKKQLQISSDQKDAEWHHRLVQKLNQENFLQLVGKMIKSQKGLKSVKDLISSINYPLLYSTQKQFELAYFYKSIPNLCKVSIVVPVYNVEKYLSECLNSLINQSWENIEIICVNDASTDDSLQILEKYQKKDTRISVYSYETNKGLSYARNFGITKCNSEFVTFVDSDDWLPKKAIENMYQAIIIPGVDWVLGKAKAHGPNLLKKEKEEFFARFYHKIGIYTLPVDIGKFVYISSWSKLQKLSIILQNQLNFPVGLLNEDQSWIWEYGLCCRRVFYLNQPVYVYRINSSSLTHGSSKVNRLFQDLLLVHIF